MIFVIIILMNRCLVFAKEHTPIAIHQLRDATLLLALTILLGIPGCGSHDATTDADQQRSAADDFLELIRGGKAGEAWDCTSTEFKSAQGRESLMRTVKMHPWLKAPLNFESRDTLAIGRRTQYEFVYCSQDARHRIRLLIAPGDGHWCIDRLKIE